MTTYFDKPNSRLVFIKQKASASYWDQHWQADDLKTKIEQAASNKYYTAVTRRFLQPKPSTRILDGGCGHGSVVLSLTRAGYDAHGVDYARQTITAASNLYPDLKLSYGDVAALDAPDKSFHGYWSLGVIEHYYEGYNAIIKEMHRVLKPNGFLFITFPHLSLLRHLKTKVNAYPPWLENNQLRHSFYQFALNYQHVTNDLSRLGFTLRYHRPIDGLKGLKDEVAWLKTPIKSLTGSPHYISRKISTAISELASPVSGHVMLQVLQKQ